MTRIRVFFRIRSGYFYCIVSTFVINKIHMAYSSAIYKVDIVITQVFITHNTISKSREKPGLIPEEFDFHRSKSQAEISPN